MHRIDHFFERLWQAYARITPKAAQVHDLLEARGGTIVNDHVAFRTFDIAPIGMDRLATAFTGLGYEHTGDYRFVEKRLRARSYSHPSGQFPRVFISELCTAEFAPVVQRAARTLAAQVDPSLAPEELLLREPTWGPIDAILYSLLLDESEYAAWTAVFGLRANHFTVNVNALEGFEDIESLNAYLESEGIALNDAGGKVKGSAEAGLTQSSTWADRVPWRFSGGAELTIPSCYYEFALRSPLPGTNTLFDGFVTESADRIFESTHVKR